jgi:hypothetical protein
MAKEGAHGCSTHPTTQSALADRWHLAALACQELTGYLITKRMRSSTDE